MIKKRFLTVMLLAISIFAFSVVAHADQIDGLVNNTTLVTAPAGLNMYVNPGGLGDALIYGYYNARNSYDFIRVVNTSLTLGVGAKVRFREGADSNEILDFFICLSAGDQWTGWIVGDTSATVPAALVWWDNDTPTYPDPQGNNTATDNFAAVVPFHYSATGAAGTVTIDDTKEGYFEIIGVMSWDDTPGSGKYVELPNECAEQLFGAATLDAPSFVQDAPQDVPNTLMGNTYIFDVSAIGAGTFAYNATPLAYCRTTALASSGLATDDPPRLDDCDNINAANLGLDEVNYVLTKSVEYFIYDIETALIGATDIIETFPTKRLSIAASVGAIAPMALNGPFNDRACIMTDGTVATSANADGTGSCTAVTTRDEALNGRCEYIAVSIFDDAENSPTTTTGFSPGETATLVKCNEVNYIIVGTGSALLNTSLLEFNLNTTGFELGWVGIDLRLNSVGATRSTTVTTSTVQGLPVIAFELQGMLDGSYTHMLPARYFVTTTNP